MHECVGHRAKNQREPHDMSAKRPFVPPNVPEPPATERHELRDFDGAELGPSEPEPLEQREPFVTRQLEEMPARIDHEPHRSHAMKLHGPSHPSVSSG
jgi:hypothetical protein